MVTKDKVLKLIDHMPEVFSVDDIISEIILLQKIQLLNYLTGMITAMQKEVLEIFS